MLAGDGLPEGGSDLVTLVVVRHLLMSVEEMSLRIDRSEGEPVAKKSS